MPIIKRADSLAHILQVISNTKYADQITLYILAEKNNRIIEEQENMQTKINVFVDVFSIGTTEDSMIDAAIKSTDENPCIIVRDYCENFSSKYLDKLIDASFENHDIIMLKNNQPKGKIKTFCENVARKFCRFLFNYSYYDGDISFVYYSPLAVNILRTTNTALLTKLNRWVAIDIFYLEMNIQEAKTNNKAPLNLLGKTVMYFALFVVFFSTLIILPILVKLHLLVTILFIFLTAAMLILALYCYLKLYNYKKIGVVHCEKVEAIDRR